MDLSELPESLDNRYIWQTVRVPSAFGDKVVPVFVFEILAPSVPVDNGDKVNTFMPTLFEAGFELTVAHDLLAIIGTAPHTDVPGVRFDLTRVDVGAFRIARGPLVAAPIDSEPGDSFRPYARATGSVLVIAGVGLNIEPEAGRYDLAPAARSGMLAAAYVPAQS